MMDNLVTFAAIAGPLAVFMIVVSGVEMYIERPANKSQVEISDLGERQKDNTKSSR